MEKSSDLSSVPRCHEDQISELPDDILVSILSKLKTMEAAQTSVLSHRWLNLWKFVPRLSFDIAEGYDHGPCPYRNLKNKKKGRRNYVDWVNHVLHLHRSLILHELIIYFDLRKDYQKEIDKWLEYAFSRRVHRLDINLSDLSRVCSDYCTFPYHLLDQCEGLSEKLFQADDCGIHLPTEVDFSCLKALHLTCVNISGEYIEVLLRKCPSLEELRVVDSGTLVNLVVSGPSLKLKHLQLTACRYAKSITISNLNIVSLTVLETTGTKRLMLSNLPMLVELSISGFFMDFERYVPVQFSCCLSQLTVLTLDPLRPKSIMNLYQFPQLGKLRRLVLLFSWGEQCLLGLTSLINTCPNLVEFVLKFRSFTSDMPVPVPVPLDVEMIQVKERPLKHLQVLELYGYYGRSCEVELINYFIRNAVALKKMVIQPRMAGTKYDYDRIASDEERLLIARRHAMENVTGLVPELTIL